MASKKNLKKAVKNICDELLTDCAYLSMCEGTPIEGLDELATQIVALNNDYVKRLSHIEKGSRKAFFQKYKTEFVDKVNAISDKIVVLFEGKADEAE